MVNLDNELPFEPMYFLSDPHKQTIIGSFLNFFWEPNSEQKVIALPDGDRISLEVTTPEGWKPTDCTVVLVHGLCGSHRSPNLVRMAHRLVPEGMKVVRFNMRGCGSGRGMARQIYHCGRSEDLFAALKCLKHEMPDSPIVLVGFSLGGNIVLKLAGELHASGKLFLQGVIAISPPVDLESSVRMLGDPANAMYERYFVRLLRADVHFRHRKFRDLPRIQLPKNLTVAEFDAQYTVPNCGFRNVQDYYNKCSSEPLIPEIRVPCKILLSADDPIISATSLEQCVLPEQVTLFKTKQGGHMGYLASPMSETGLHWLDAMLVDWITSFGKREGKLK